MILIIGLGNPGKKFIKTRHNIGFRVIDEIAEKNNFPEFKSSKKFKAEISEGVLDSEKIILVKPQTFMNESGLAVNKLTRTLLVNLWVIHDDIDLPLGKIKIVKNRGHGGHKGVASIIDELGTKNFVRFRLGIAQKPKAKSQKPKLQAESQKIDKFVLERFNKDEEKNVKQVIEKTCQAIEMAIKNGLEKAMSEYNQ